MTLTDPSVRNKLHAYHDIAGSASVAACAEAEWYDPPPSSQEKTRVAEYIFFRKYFVGS